MTDGSDPTHIQSVEVRRSAHGDVAARRHPVRELADGQIRLRLERFAVTANNVSYAGAGDLLGYWDFFPSESEPDVWGRVPAMGWATIVESRNPELPVGGRYYGWFPMAEHVTITATPTRDGFRDDGEHRQPHAPIYRAFIATDRDQYLDGSPEEEERHSVLRVLFLTGFLADEFFADSGGTSDEAYFGADQVVVLSASSKTAIGFAQRAGQRDGLDVIGVTSPDNAEFVRAIGFYDRVVTYDDLSSIPEVDSVLIDMAGNRAVLEAVHEHLGEHLKYSMMVGRSHHDAPVGDGALVGPTPEFFFAPADVERRVGTWGAEEYQRRTTAGMREFIDASRAWLAIDHRQGVDGALAAWADVYGGDVAPDVGVVVTFGDA